MMSTQVSSYMDSQLDHCVSAYRKNYSCETTLLALTENRKLTLDSKQCIGLLLRDMSKGFDSLLPPLMINKLQAYGFSDEALSLMRSYFTETNQS